MPQELIINGVKQCQGILSLKVQHNNVEHVK